MMPIPIVKALIQGQPPARRLFVPLIFALAARLENILLPNFVSNPTKIANSLIALYQRLRPDGVTCYFDLFIVAEALGCRLDWSTSYPTFERPTRETALKMVRQVPSEVKQHGRLPVALDVAHRLQKRRMSLSRALSRWLRSPFPLHRHSAWQGHTCCISMNWMSHWSSCPTGRICWWHSGRRCAFMADCLFSQLHTPCDWGIRQMRH